MKLLQLFSLLTLFTLSKIEAQAQVYEVDKILSGHIGAVQNIRFSPKGKYLASGGLNDYKVLIWDVESGEMLHNLSGHNNSIHEVTFSPDGRLLASAGKDGLVMVWNPQTGKMAGMYHVPPKMNMVGEVLKSVVFVCFDQESKVLYFGGASGAIYRVPIGIDKSGMYYEVEVLANANPSDLALNQITGGGLTPDGKGIMVSIDRLVRVFDLKTGALIKNFYYPYEYLNDVAKAPNNQIATWSYDGFVTVWDYTDAKIVKRLQVSLPKTYSAASFSSDGKYLSTGAFGTSARVWEWNKEKLAANLSGHGRIVRMTRFHPRKHLIASASYDGTVRLWKMKNEEVIHEKTTVIKTKKPAAGKAERLSPPEDAPIEAPEQNTVTKKELPSLTEKSLVVGASIKMEHIQFKRGSYELTPEAKIDLDAILKVMEKYPTMEIEIHGHTDNAGRADLNLKLSERRAIVSRNYLINKGISEGRVMVKAFGGTKPLVNNDTDINRKRNRRIELLIVKK